MMQPCKNDNQNVMVQLAALSSHPQIYIKYYNSFIYKTTKTVQTK